MKGRVLGIVVAVAVMIGPSPAWAQRLYGLGQWEGELDLGFEHGRQRTTTEGAPATESSRMRYEERLVIRNLGSYILDPRIVSNNLTASFGLFQEDSQFDGLETFQSGTLLGYSFDSAILSATPYAFTLFTNRAQSVTSREFGGRSEIIFENRGGTFRLSEDSVIKDLGIPYFSALLGARQQLTDEETSVLGQTFKREEVQTTLSVEANKGFETADVGLRYEFTDREDRENPLSDFQNHSADLSSSLDFGPALNRRWDSRLQYTARTGRASRTFLSADERLRLDHFANFSTDYGYSLSRSDTNGSVTTTQTGSLGARHRLYENLTTNLRGQGTLQDLEAGERLQYAGRLDLDYQRSLPWRGRVLAGAGVGYQVDDNRLEVARIEVVDEPHTAPTPLGGGVGFTLVNPFVLPSTIVVVDTRGGARLPTTEGIDYVVVQEGDFTKIVPLPTSPVILAGDPLVVSYATEVDPSLKFSTLSWRGLLGADFRWIALSVTREQSEQTLLGGRDGRFLDDRTVDRARLELRGDWESVRALSTAEYEVHESTRLAFTRRRFGQSASLRVFDLVLGADAQESFTEFTVPERRSESYAIRGTLDWFPTPSLFVAGFVAFRASEDSQLPAETVREAGVRARWRFGKLEVVPAFRWSIFERGSTETTDQRIELRVVRRF